MASQNISAISAFIEGAPSGELNDVVKGLVFKFNCNTAVLKSSIAKRYESLDIKALTTNDSSLLEKARPSFQKYHEEQLTQLKLPGGSQHVLVSPFNRLEDGRYFDVESNVSWSFDYVTGKASDVQSYSSDSEHLEIISSLYQAFSTHAAEHYPTSPAFAVIPPSPSSNSIILLLSASKYSPSNYWNGRFRCVYHLNPAENTLTGTIKVAVHYYEDGNVRLSTAKEVSPMNVPLGGQTADVVVREIAKAEKKYHEDLNRGFGDLSETSFKALRRQLPVTRQKMEWEKVGSYKAGREIGGVGGRR